MIRAVSRHTPAGVALRVFANSLVVVLALGLTGCTGLFQSTAPPEQIYYLSVKPVPAGDNGQSALKASIHVGRPISGPGLDSTHIMLLESNHRMSYYAASRWPAPLPEMVEALAVQELNASGSWGAVQGAESSFPSDYLLQIRITRFEADYTNGNAGPEVHVVLDCTLGRRTGRDVMVTFVAAGSASATANKLGEVLSAFEQATDEALATLAAQAAKAVRD